MFTNVEKELKNALKKQKTLAKGNDVITDVNKLLEYDNTRDLEILRKLSPNSSLTRAEALKGHMLDLEKQEDFYSGAIYTHRQIIRLAKKYRLKFLPSSLYIGDLDATIPMEIRKMEDAITKSTIKERAIRENITEEEFKIQNPGFKMDLDYLEISKKFMILAPPSCFNLKTERMNMKIKWVDPVLFYKINGYYRLIKKWGSDFTIFRRFLGFKYKNQGNFRFFQYVLPTFLVFALITYILYLYTHISLPILTTIVGLIVCFLIQYVFQHNLKVGNSKLRLTEAFTDGGWCENDTHFIGGTAIVVRNRMDLSDLDRSFGSMSR